MTDPVSGIVSILTVAVAAVGAITGILALVQNHEMRTKPRLEFVPLYVHADPFRWGSRASDEDSAPTIWWTEVTKKVQIRNWGNGVAYDVRLHTDDGVDKKDFLLGNLEPGASVDQEYVRVTGPGRTPRAWVEWDTYPGPKRHRHELQSGWGVL